jgi:hypothetical protein
MKYFLLIAALCTVSRASFSLWSSIEALSALSGASLSFSSTVDCETTIIDEDQQRSRLINAIASYNPEEVKNILPHVSVHVLNSPCNLPEALWRKIGTTHGIYYTPTLTVGDYYTSKVSPLFLALKLLNESDSTDPNNKSLRSIMKLLLDKKADPNMTFNTTDFGSRPLNIRPLRIALQKRDEQVVELLLKAGADPCIDVTESDSLLLQVRKDGDFPLFQLLLSNPKKVLDLSSAGGRLLYNAVSNNAFKHVELLVAHNADITGTIENQLLIPLSAFDFAMSRGQGKTYLDALVKGTLSKKDRLKKALERFRAYAQLADAVGLPPYVLLEIVDKIPGETDIRQDIAALLLQEVNEPNSVLGNLHAKRARYLRVLLTHSKKAAMDLITEDLTKLFKSIIFRESYLVHTAQYYGREYEYDLEKEQGRRAYLEKSLAKLKQHIERRANEIGAAT